MPRLGKAAVPSVGELMKPSPEPEVVDLGTGAVKSGAQRWVIAVDPGDAHCGMAEGLTHSNGQFEVVRAWELAPDDCADYVAGWLLSGELEALVVERFSLYADKASQQVGSQMETAQLIGVLKYLVRVAGNAKLAMQGADIKRSMRAQLKARGISLLPAEADHARDAQLHLWHWVGREKMGWGA